MPELNDPAIYQTILEGLDTGVYIVDLNRRIRFWNEGAEKITGYLTQDARWSLLARPPADQQRRIKKDLDKDPGDPHKSWPLRDGRRFDP